MKVVLLREVKGLGVGGSVCTVGDGYALNFLIPQGQAVEENSERGRQLLQQHAAKSAQKKQQSKAADAELEALPEVLTVVQKANEQGTLFQAVTGPRLVELFSAQGYSTAVEWFSGVAIKELGEHTLSLQQGEKERVVTIRIERE